jgi:cobalt-zinc-cadmium efflux system membrane fusion protein
MLLACEPHSDEHHFHNHGSHDMHEEAEKGPRGGHMLTDENFSLEITIFESGIPSEFRVYAYDHDKLINPQDVALKISLTRLGNKVEVINFISESDYLRGDKVIVEPHSFIVSIDSSYKGKTYHWEYDNFEGRTKINSELAQSAGIITSVAGPETIEESIIVYGQIVANPENIREVSARFDGVIRSMQASIGDVVKEQQTLAKVESNESLSTYSLKAPIEGVITERFANTGEQTNGRQLFTIMNTSTVWANLQIFPNDRDLIKHGNEVTITISSTGKAFTGSISNIDIVADANQAVAARVILDNTDGHFIPGSYVTAKINISHHEAPLAVKRSALQQFRDFTVVYAKIEDEYEVRMLELGRQDDQWVEVLGGLDAGTHYVSANSYLVKADIEKAGASHDH